MFIGPLANFLNEKFPIQSSKFLSITDTRKDIGIIETGNFFHLKTPIRYNFFHNYFILAKLIYNSDKIILHGIQILLLLFLFPFSMKKVHWIIYGGSDLRELKSLGMVKKFLYKTVVRRFGYHISHIEGDSGLANKWYKSNAKFIYNPTYFSNTHSSSLFKSSTIETGSKLKILVGNSASKSNLHIEVFKILEKFKNENIEIICPVSYGNALDYLDTIVEFGEGIFGNKITFLKDFLTIEEYSKLLEEVHIAIFNHNRQEAMGVTLLLIAKGKIIYMRPGTTSFNSFKSRGFQIFDINNFSSIEEGYKAKDIEINKLLIDKYYSEEVLFNSWRKIYDTINSQMNN